MKTKVAAAIDIDTENIHFLGKKKIQQKTEQLSMKPLDHIHLI